MKAKLTADFSLRYMGKLEKYTSGQILEGFPARRALAKRVAVPYTEPVIETRAFSAAPEEKEAN